MKRLLPALVYLTKTAGIKTPLQSQQQRVVNKIQQPDQKGLVVAHGLGSGKTLTSVAAQEATGLPADIVTPAALGANYRKEVKKHVRGPSPKRHYMSMQNMASKKTPPANPMMIVDEAHRARDPQSATYKQLAAAHPDKTLLLTGSPFYNHPADLSSLVNLAAQDDILPTNREDFSKEYIANRRVNPGFFGRLRGLKPGVVPELNKKREGELRDIYNKWVDYEPGSQEHFPSVEREDVKVPMTGQQVDAYDTMLKKAPPWVAAKIRSRLPPSKTESQQLNAFLSATRQISNTTAPFDKREGVEAQDPKIQMAYDRLKQQLDANPRAKAVVYSNYLGAGLNPYRDRLQKANIPFGEFTGEMPRKQRDQLVQDYNANKIRALLLSSAGGEGLDLQGTRLVQMLDPHWNNEKLRQVEGRGIRYMSHDSLPEEERNVRVERYLATRPRRGIGQRLHLSKPGGSVDEYLAQRATEKDQLNEQFRGLLRQPQGAA